MQKKKSQKEWFAIEKEIDWGGSGPSNVIDQQNKSSPFSKKAHENKLHCLLCKHFVQTLFTGKINTISIGTSHLCEYQKYFPNVALGVSLPKAPLLF